MGLQEYGFFINLIRSLFGLLDNIVYGLIKWILYGIFDLSSLTTNSDIFNGIYARIYVVLGIFMAFKLSFSFFQYIIDPESMTGKNEKGVGKLFGRVFIMLFALILLPSLLFGQSGQKGLLARAQDAFLPVLPRLIFGTNDFGNTSTSSGVTATVEQSADELAATTLRGFFYPPEELDSVCGNGTYENTPQIEKLEDFNKNLHLTCNATGTGVLGIGATKYYKYSYMLFVSTVVGVLVAALLLGITLDIAKRIFKLIILEVIAPVPIMSLIDPKGSKDGAFSKWVHNLITTFLDIFLKIGLVYIIIVLIHMIVSAGLFTNFPTFQENGIRATYLTIFLILGLIFFAKEAPKFIKDSLGLKDSGSGDLFSDVKSIGKAAGLVGGAAVGAAGILGSAATNYRAASEENAQLHEGQRFRNGFRNVGSAIAGAIGGAAVGTRALFGKNGGPGSVLDAQSKRNARRANHSTLLGRIGSGAYGTITGRGLSELGNAQLKYNQDAFKAFKDYKSTLEEEALKQTNLYGTYGGHQFNYQRLSAALERARGSGASTFDYSDGVNTYTGLSTDDFDTNVMNDIKSTQAAEFADKILTDETFRTEKGGTAWNSYQTAKAAASNVKMRDSDGNEFAFDGKYSNTKKSMGAVKTAATKAETDMKYQMRRANDRSKK